MTKEKRKSLRAWSEKHRNHESFTVSNWAKDTLELIDALEEAETLIAANRRELKETDSNSAAKDREYKKHTAEPEKDRDYWKQRAEAVEKAIRQPVIEISVIDNTTGKYPDLESIALNEEWAKDLIYCDMEGFYIGESGELILTDQCGNSTYCPAGRFTVNVRLDISGVEK